MMAFWVRYHVHAELQVYVIGEQIAARREKPVLIELSHRGRVQEQFVIGVKEENTFHHVVARQGSGGLEPVAIALAVAICTVSKFVAKPVLKSPFSNPIAIDGL